MEDFVAAVVPLDVTLATADVTVCFPSSPPLIDCTVDVADFE